MSKRLPSPNLPAVTFLCGGSQHLRTEVANLLADLTFGGQAHSFSSPLRDGILGTFFMGDPTIDIDALADHPIFPSPLSPTFSQFTKAYAQFLSAFFSDPSIIGRIAVNRINDNRDHFYHFIFDDADTKENIRLIADLFGRENAMIVNFGEPSLTSTSIKVLSLPSSLPPDARSIIEYLAHSLNPKPLPVPPVVPIKDASDDIGNLL